MNPTCCSCSKLVAENERLNRWLHAEISARLIEYLASLVVECEGELVILRPPTHPQIARVIGSRRETVSLRLSDLKRAGHVSARQRCGSTTRITVSRAFMNMAARVVMNGSEA